MTEYTNGISTYEQAANAGHITDAEKLSSIGELLRGVTHGQATGLLLCMTVLPWALMLLSHELYQRHYKLDEEEYDRIVAALGEKKA